MTDKPNLLPPKHIDYLDSARGIAAIMVMVGHYAGWAHPFSLKMKPVAILFNASDAVSFFFILSGFVLSYKYLVLKEPLDIRKYFINRLFRLWPAFFLTVFICALANLGRHGLDGQTLIDHFIFNKNRFWEEAMLPWSRVNYYGPGWTLVLELGLSFYLPFAVVLAHKNVKLLYWAAFTFFLFAPTNGCNFHAHFLAGVLICCYYHKITDPSFKETRWYKYRHLLIAVAMVLFSLRQINRISEIGSSLIYFMEYIGIGFFQYSGLASVIFLVAMLHSDAAKKVLRHKLLLFMGRISFGIYLMHWALVDGIFFYWERILPHFPNYRTAFCTVFALYVLATVVLATILHYTVELPFIRLGKRITRKMKPSLVV